MSIERKYTLFMPRRPAGTPPHHLRRLAGCIESGTEITPFPSIHNKENRFGPTV
jgi:hypothetical protein